MEKICLDLKDKWLGKNITPNVTLYVIILALYAGYHYTSRTVCYFSQIHSSS